MSHQVSFAFQIDCTASDIYNFTKPSKTLGLEPRPAGPFQILNALLARPPAMLCVDYLIHARVELGAITSWATLKHDVWLLSYYSR